MNFNKIELKDVVLLSTLILSAGIQWGSNRAKQNALQQSIEQVRLDVREIRAFLFNYDPRTASNDR
jgi:hypothetical protein